MNIDFETELFWKGKRLFRNGIQVELVAIDFNQKVKFITYKDHSGNLISECYDDPSVEWRR